MKSDPKITTIIHGDYNSHQFKFLMKGKISCYFIIQKPFIWSPYIRLK